MLSNIRKMGFFWRNQPKEAAKPIKPTEAIEEEIEPEIEVKSKIQQELSSRTKLPDKDDYKLTVFLELDGILFSTYIPHKTEAYYNKPMKKTDYEFDVTMIDEDVPLMLYMRPHWKKFLEYLRENTETIIYSRCQNYFIDQIIENIGESHFDFIKHRLGQEECALLSSKFDDLNELTKSIGGLNRELNRSILIDHWPLSFILEPNNAVTISEYDASQDRYNEDTHLLELIKVIKQCQGLEDVRPYLQQKFGIETMIKEMKFT